MKKKLFKLLMLVLVSSSYAQINVDVNDNSTMYIKEATFVYVSNDGDVNIEANANLIMDSTIDKFSNLYVDGDSSGDAEYRVWAPTATTSRDFLASPVPGQAFNTFSVANSNLAQGTITTANKLFGPFNNNGGTYSEWAATDTNIIEAGIGYRTAATSASTLSFDGGVRTDDIPVTISFGLSGVFRYQNIVGNPFTTYLSADAYLDEMIASNAIDTRYVSIYGWDGAADPSQNGTKGETWELINKASIAASAAADYLIPPGQGFVLISDNDSQDEVVEFKADMRRVSRTGDGFLVPTLSAMSNSNVFAGSFKILLKDTNMDRYYSTRILFFDNHVGRGMDPSWDAAKPSIGNVGIGSLLADNSDTMALRMQSLNSEDIFNVSNSDLVIPLHVNARAGRPFTFKIDEVSIPVGSEIYLEDTLSNTMTLLNNEDYTFTPSSNISGPGRFYLRTSNNNSLSTVDVEFDGLDVRSLEGQKTLMISGKLTNVTTVNIIDITGRIVATQKLVNISTNNHTIKVSNLSTGAYIVSLNDTEGRSKDVKVIIN